MSVIISGIRASLPFIYSELALALGLVVVLTTGLIQRESRLTIWLTLLTVGASFISLINVWHTPDESVTLFSGMLHLSNFSVFMRLLIDFSAALTVLMTWRSQQRFLSEYFVLVLAATLGAHVLTMSTNVVMIFLSLELLSISSYLLTAFLFTRQGTEGALKYFLFGATASAAMLYGFSWLYGMSGSLDITSLSFISLFTNNISSDLVLIAGSLVLAGFLYKLAAAPMHPWSPDVYEAAPIPVVAFFSVVPKLAGLAVLIRFVQSVYAQGNAVHDWQFLLAAVVLLSITFGNFSALWQKNAKRLMAYSSIAQAGFLLIGALVLNATGLQAVLFYSAVYVCMNYLAFLFLHYFEKRDVKTIAEFQGAGKNHLLPSLFLLVALVSLTGLPPTAGFTGKLLVFATVWESYQASAKNILLVLLVVGLLNTVISLFYYLRIPYYAFIKTSETNQKTNILTFENFLGAILVFIILYLFFSPELLMGWINKITFVL